VITGWTHVFPGHHLPEHISSLARPTSLDAFFVSDLQWRLLCEFELAGVMQCFQRET